MNRSGIVHDADVPDSGDQQTLGDQQKLGDQQTLGDRRPGSRLPLAGVIGVTSLAGLLASVVLLVLEPLGALLSVESGLRIAVMVALVVTCVLAAHGWRVGRGSRQQSRAGVQVVPAGPPPAGRTMAPEPVAGGFVGPDPAHHLAALFGASSRPEDEAQCPQCGAYAVGIDGGPTATCADGHTFDPGQRVAVMAPSMLSPTAHLTDANHRPPTVPEGA